MGQGAPAVRRGEYATRGDYHRTPDPSWDFYPTYLAKLELVRAYLNGVPSGSRVLDAGCGEGLLVEEFGGRLNMQGVDPNYASDHVVTGSVLALPYELPVFDRVLCLDVLEHLPLGDQSLAFAELRRVLRSDGELLVSVPNLAHLQSRVHFLLRGALMRTANERKHPGDRPVGEYVQLARNAGFELVARRGIFPTVPVITHWIRRHPARLRGLHDGLTRLLPIPGWCLLNLLRFRVASAPRLSA